MARKKTNLSAGVLFIALLLIGFGLLFAPQEKTGRINYLFVKISDALNKFLPKEKDSGETVPKSEFIALEQKYHNLYSRFNQLHEDYEILSKIRKAPPLPGPAIVISRVIRKSLTGQRRELIINKGLSNGLKPGQYVLSAKGGAVIGTIYALSETAARVQLVTDANHHIPVYIWKEWLDKKIPGVLTGNNKNGGSIPNFSAKEYDIEVGDAVYASRKPEYLNTPLIIGKITKAEHADYDPLLWDLTVTTLDDFNTISSVAVVVIDTEIESDKDKDNAN